MAEKIKIKKPFDPSEKVQVNTGNESFVQQQFKDSTDVNKILAKFRRTGVVDHANQYQGQYGDFSDVTDYHTAMTIVAEADEMFMGLPSQVRKLFSNDPGEFLEFAENPENRHKMIELGLISGSGEPAEVKPAVAVQEPEPKAKVDVDSKV